MAIEIERKFLLTDLPFHLMTQGTPICQGYIANGKNRVVRVRIAGNKGFLTIKGAVSTVLRNEFEYPVPEKDAREMLTLFCRNSLIEKTRYHIDFRGSEWIIDEFHGNNQGLVVAEIELASIDQSVEIPDWIGKEVTDDPRYLNSNLIDTPYSKW